MQKIIRELRAIIGNEGGFSLMSLIPGGLNLIGNLLGLNEQRKQRKQQAAMVQQQRDDQYAFAKSGIQWRVADAEAAGIHPLAAIGAPMNQPAPTMVGGMDGGGMGVSDVVKDLGQDVSRALSARTTQHQRKLMDLNLRSAKAETEMKELELTSQRRRLQGQIGPPEPQIVPKRITPGIPGKEHIELGQGPSVSFEKGPKGSLYIVPSKVFKERSEDMFAPEASWNTSEYLGRMFGNRSQPKVPEKYRKMGYTHYEFSPLTGRLELAKDAPKLPLRKVKKNWKNWMKMVAPPKKRRDRR
jgi:hypothetical protein